MRLVSEIEFREFDGGPEAYVGRMAKAVTGLELDLAQLEAENRELKAELEALRQREEPSGD